MYRKRLKNVYDLLETGNNKKVIQEVEKLVASSASTSQATATKKKQQPAVQPLSNEAGYDEETTMVHQFLKLINLNK